MIEGIPDGWELVAFRESSEGEYFVDNEGKIEKWTLGRKSGGKLVIIRKIENPKQYRPFANAAEAYCLWDAVLKLANPANGSEDSRYRINSITRDGATFGLQFFDYRKAFEMFVCDDGTPFGIEVTE